MTTPLETQRPSFLPVSGGFSERIDCLVQGALTPEEEALLRLEHAPSLACVDDRVVDPAVSQPEPGKGLAGIGAYPSIQASELLFMLNPPG
jgi:hypothetical protein